MTRPCDVDSTIVAAPAVRRPDPRPRGPGRSRREFLKRAGTGLAALTCADFLAYFTRFGLPPASRAAAMARDAAAAGHNPNFLVYWFLEGGWLGYDMFNPVMTPNNLRHRLENVSDERYRILHFGEPGHGIERHGNIRHGYLANGGVPLFQDMAVISSMHTGTSHSTERLRAHMGTYDLKLRAEREPDERSVTQAFAEVYGQAYALPNVSWHWWLADGELNEAQFTGRRGYYHALGPVHAHTIYAGTPARLKGLLSEMLASSGDAVSREVQRFLDGAARLVLKDENIEAVKSFHSARQIYLQLVAKGLRIDRGVVQRLFRDPALREEFGVSKEDELMTYRSVNGNKARTKFSPNTNVQAMMTYELLRAGMTCAAWIESRDIRRYDSHRSRGALWQGRGRDRQPVGQTDQTAMMKQDLWDPLAAFVARLKSTPCGTGGDSLFDHTTIVITSEFGRSIHGNVDSVLHSNLPAAEKERKINGQDICQHWKVTSAAFLGGRVRGDSQFGSVGERTLLAVPILPSGRMDPAYDPISGELRRGRRRDPRAFVPDHGSIYATALDLHDIDPAGRGRNESRPLRFVKRTRAWF